jgi:hypothetical protein
MKARYFTYEKTPKAVYYLTDIRQEIYPNHTIEEFYKEIETKWTSNPSVIIVDDRETSYSSGEIEISQIDKYLEKLEQIKKQLEEDDEEKA